MNLNGGIDEYGGFDDIGKEKRYGAGPSAVGRKIRFTGNGGYDHEIESAKKLFSVGQVVTIKELYVGRSSSKVELEEVEGQFNTCLFEDLGDEQCDN